MHTQRIIPLLAALSICTCIEATFAKNRTLQNGMTEKELISTLGEPKGVISSGSKKTFMYDGAQVQVIKGVVVELPDNLPDLLEEGKRNRDAKNAYIKEQKRKGLVFYKGKWLKPAQRQDLEAKAMLAVHKKRAIEKKAAKNGYVMHTKDNQPISHSQYLSRNSVTVLDFYAEWCGPCRTLAPKLEQLVDNHNGVVLQKIDIGTWGSSIANNYNISSVPNVRVFDRNGNMIGPPTSSLSTIAAYIEQAKKQ